MNVRYRKFHRMRFPVVEVRLQINQVWWALEDKTVNFLGNESNHDLPKFIAAMLTRARLRNCRVGWVRQKAKLSKSCQKLCPSGNGSARSAVRHCFVTAYSQSRLFAITSVLFTGRGPNLDTRFIWLIETFQCAISLATMSRDQDGRHFLKISLSLLDKRKIFLTEYKKCMNKFKLTLSISIQLGIWYNNYISKDIYKYQTNLPVLLSKFWLFNRSIPNSKLDRYR